MLLTLRILSDDGAAPASSDSVVIDESGGKIGRGKAMNLSLADPDRIISNEHAAIIFQDGQFLITDNSTNGTFINQSDVALGRGNSAPISNGDQLRVGRFVIVAEISDGSAAAPQVGAPLAANPLLDMPGSANTPGIDGGMAVDQNPAGDLMATSPLQGSSPLSQMPVAGPVANTSGSGLIPQDESSLAEANRPAGGSLIPDDRPFIPNDFGSNDMKPADPLVVEDSAQPDGASLMSTAFQMPGASPDAASIQGGISEGHQPDRQPDAPLPVANGLVDGAHSSGIPSDWDADGDSPASGADHAPGQTSSEEPTGAQGQADILPQDWESPGPSSTAPPGAAEPMAPQPVQSGDQPAASPVPGPESAPPPSVAGAPAHDFVNRILESAGLGAMDLSGTSTDVVAENLGLIIREAVDGIVEVLRDRSNFKSEFRLDVTRIQASENNPLKFSTTTEDVVRQLLTNERAGLMVSGDAFREAFDDLRIHQLATMVALKACLSALMARLDPVMIEEQLRGRGGLKAKMSSKRRAECWDMFLEFYNKLAADADEGFRSLLADEFVRAYEEQVDRMHHARFGTEN